MAAGNNSLPGEASVWYLSSNTAAERIKEFVPDAKILIHVRNPVDLILSYHSELIYLGYEDIEDIEQALDVEQQRHRGLHIPDRCPVPRVLYYSEIANLTEQIERFIAIFGRQNVHINIFEDFIVNPADVYRRTLDFLGVNPLFTTTFEIINSNKAIRYPVVRAFIDRPPDYLRQAAKLVLPQSMRETIREWLWAINTRFIQRAEVNPRVRTRLTRQFAGEVERLRNLLSRDLTAALPPS
jgi:hypothetical protein